jgi:hypothetical protein
MDTNRNMPEDELSKLFKEIPFDEPSPDFMGNLMMRIEKEVAREKRKYRWLTAGQIAASLSGMLVLPALAIYLCTLFLPGYSFSFPKIHVDFSANLIVIGIAVLLLLIFDTLFRTRAANQKKHDL